MKFLVLFLFALSIFAAAVVPAIYADVEATLERKKARSHHHHDDDHCHSYECPLGPIGQEGEQGYRGDKGATGDTGAAGPQGAAGAQGPQGSVGSSGPQGPAGFAGAQGPPGPVGLAGVDGPAGLAGFAGVEGPAGLIGDAGPQGASGITGAQGPSGPVGLQGIAGPQGIDGVEGAPGQTGAQGAQGPAGTSVGPDGPQGPAGPPGPALRAYASFYHVGGGEIIGGDLIPFETAGLVNTGITVDGKDTTFTVANDGVYRIYFSLEIDPAQPDAPFLFQIIVNSDVLSGFWFATDLNFVVAELYLILSADDTVSVRNANDNPIDLPSGNLVTAVIDFMQIR